MKFLLLALFTPITAFCQFTFKEVDHITQQMRLSQYECFVIKSTGDTVFGSKLKGPSGVGKAYDYFRDGRDDIKLDDAKYDVYRVRAIQDQYAYYSIMWVENILKNQVPNFVKLVLRGKINLYYAGERIKSGGNKSDAFAFQKGDLAPIKELTREELRSLLSDNKQALELFDQYFGRRNLAEYGFKFKKIMEVINLYNTN